jgi:putative oxidoreductase
VDVLYTQNLILYMMMNESQRKMLESTGILVGRSLIGVLFLVSGYGMFAGGVAGTAGYFASVGIPMAGIAAWVAIIIKICGGLALILGYRVGLAAGALILFTLGASYFGHHDLSDQMNQIAVMKNLAIIGGLLYVMAFGAGTGWRLKK